MAIDQVDPRLHQRAPDRAIGLALVALEIGRVIRLGAALDRIEADAELRPPGQAALGAGVKELRPTRLQNAAH